MRQVTIYTTDREYNHFVKLAKNLHYVKRIETDEDNSIETVVDNLRKGFEEMDLLDHKE